ncbi:hypothetical protein K8R66_03895, partial [bacterium]|nr:hypothetical protein [bacterium]
MNNSQEELKLFDCQNNLIWRLDYEKSFEGQSYNYDLNKQDYFWAKISPGEKNISLFYSEIVAEDQINQIELDKFNDQAQLDDMKRIYDFKEIKELDKNEKVLIKGIIVSLPNEIYKNTFYICNYDLETINYDACMGIYFNENLDLEYGDIVETQGKVNHLSTRSRIKIYDLDDLRILEQIKLQNFDLFDIEEIDEEMKNNFISLNGKISKINKKSFYIQDEEENEFKIKINNSKISLDDFKKGDHVLVSGFLIEYSDRLIL